MKKLLLILLVVGAGVCTYFLNRERSIVANIQSKTNEYFVTNIVKETNSNTNFRKVIFTGTRSQLVVMDIPVGGEVGEEIHKYTEQTLFFLSGTGKAIINGVEKSISAGDVVVVTPGTRHNFINTGKTALKIYTTYSPPNHLDGRIHITKNDGDKDVADEEVENILR